MGRYTLVMQSYSRQKVQLRFNVDGKRTEKVSLKTIDDLTTKMFDDYELSSRMTEGQDKTNKFHITYIQGGKTLSLPVAYKDKKRLSEVQLVGNTSNVRTDDRIFISVMEELLRKLENKDFYRYAIYSGMLNEKQIEYIKERIAQGDYSFFVRSKILEHSSTYRSLRNIVFLMDEFDKEQLRLKEEALEAQRLAEEEDDYDPDVEGFLSEEEKIAYAKYMEGLPDECEHPHKNRY